MIGVQKPEAFGDGNKQIWNGGKKLRPKKEFQHKNGDSNQAIALNRRRINKQESLWGDSRAVKTEMNKIDFHNDN